MAFLGKLFLILSALISVFLAGYILYALGQKGKHKERGFRNSYWGIIWLFFTVSISTFVLLAAFIAKDFTFQYVASHSSADMALVYRIAALWAGQEGSLLLWLWMTAAIAAVIAFRKLKDPDTYTAHVLLVMNVVNFFFLLVLLVSSDPFKTATSPVAAGMGINPLLLHWAMILHPPTVFMGNALLTVPFAYAIAAMLLKKSDASWVNLCRRWTIFAWIFVSLGIFLGALWAYVVLGWGGYWGWDPVENASLLPWLTATALLHSFTAYRHRGNFKMWSISLAIVSFLLTVVATFITRSGLVQSVHAFQRDPFFTFIFAVFMALIVFGGFGLLYSRRKLFASAESFTSLLSREFTYYISNLILVISTAIVLTATVLPSFTGMQMGPQFYNRIAPPIGLVFLLVLTLCPLFSWRKTDTAKLMRSLYLPFGATALAAAPLFVYWRGLEAGIRSVNASRQPAVLGYVGWLIAVFSLVVVLQLFVSLARQRSRRFETGFFASLFDLFRFSPSQAGGFITHLGVVVMVIGLAGSSMFVLNTKKRIDNVPGSTFEVDNLVMSFRQVDTSTAPNRETYEAIFDIYNKSNRGYVGTIRPKIVFYQLQNQSTREVDIRYEVLRDIFVIFEGVDSDNKLVMNAFVNPLVSWVWVGGLVLILGSLFALLPHRHDLRLEREEGTASGSKAM